MSRKKHTIEDCIVLAKERKGMCLSKKYINAHEYLIWKCELGHIWSQRYNNIQQGNWCPRCREERIRRTNFQKFGVENPMQNKDIQEKVRQTNLKVYGFENPSQNKQVREKIEQTCIERYGCESPLQNKQILEKIKKTNLERRGFENPFSSGQIKEKIKQTCLEVFGVENPMQNKGVQEKGRQTLLKNYGVEHPTQNKEISLKAAKNSNNSSVLYHWKTNEEIVCRGSYESAAVRFLNDKKENFNWQIRFDMPDGRKYFVDLHLPERDLYVEIKGYKRPKSMAKYEWFHKEHPNSELWDKEKLKEMGIL